MIQALALGLGLLLALMLASRWFATASPAAVLRLLKWGGIALALVIVLVMIRTGAIGLLWAAAAALAPWLVRAMYVRSAFRRFRNAFGTAPSGGWRDAGAGAQARTSAVETRYLQMSLDHDSGTFDGEVREGEFRGRRLCQLALAELARLWRECQADPQSAQVLEAWLERHHPDWRDTFFATAEPAAGGQMSREEAYAVLGLRPGASADEIRIAHRRLMMRCHPDHGGSDWLASRLNQAKDMLLSP